MYYTKEQLKLLFTEWEQTHRKKEAAGVMSGKKVRRTGQPQQKFGCLCPRMRTYRGDIKSSTCRDCIERGFVSTIMIEGRRVPNCTTCQCQCDVGMFFEKDIQAIRVATARKKEIEAREKQPNDS